MGKSTKEIKSYACSKRNAGAWTFFDDCPCRNYKERWFQGIGTTQIPQKPIKNRFFAFPNRPLHAKCPFKTTLPLTLYIYLKNLRNCRII